MDFLTISTERLVLRQMTPAVYDHVFATYSDAELVSFFGLAGAAELARKKQTHRDGLTMFNKSFLYFQLLKKDTGYNIGWCGFHTWYTQHARAEIGYVLTDETERQKGFMKEALQEVIRYGFEEMKLHRIEAFIGPTNIPSLTLAAGVGFVREGLLREHYCKEGRMEDSAVFSILRKEYEDRKALLAVEEPGAVDAQVAQQS